MLGKADEKQDFVLYNVTEHCVKVSEELRLQSVFERVNLSCVNVTVIEMERKRFQQKYVINAMQMFPE